MASTQTFSGSAVFAQWIHAGGTVTLTGNQRSVSLTPTGDMIDTSAGSDEWRTRLPSIKDWSASISLLMPVGGTALEDAIAAGTQGTLIVGPEGTASGKRKYSGAAISGGGNVNMPYADVVEMSCDFQGNGELQRVTW